MRITVWCGTDQKSKRRMVGKTKKALLDKIASRCNDTHVIREFHVWKSYLSVTADWAHGVIEAIGSGMSEDNVKLLGRDYLVPDESSRCNCFFARSKCIDEVQARPITSVSQEDDTNS